MSDQGQQLPNGVKVKFGGTLGEGEVVIQNDMGEGPDTLVQYVPLRVFMQFYDRTVKYQRRMLRLLVTVTAATVICAISAVVLLFR